MTDYDRDDCNGASSSYFLDKEKCYTNSYSKTVYSLVEGTSPGTSPVTSPVTPPVTSPTSVGTLKGYVAKVFYSDATCKTPYLATFTALDTCAQTGLNEYEYVTATSSTVKSVGYTDSQCRLGAGSVSTTSYTDGACVSRTKIYVTSTTSYTANDANAVVR